ncbi:hypothetical protein PPTG_03084 [Phytophthora nicotianae INRA-310]|uniref:Uncharacterized protein n=1 Tax=Phytophthora nicotianae (strain INRA-310) TaxID=761204 RepID=W2R3Z7_PHYN3|nr:hypothetical protein PPTG_03084 [Phytophthora nicotianae INRA-310]ETN19981.1 hypothetical protein PPTG_03084 [Phytophthora nicotianae INRA-310]
MVDHPQYDPPKSILKHTAIVSNQIVKMSDRREDKNTAEEMPKGDEAEGSTKTKPIENAPEPPTAGQPLEDDQVCISEGGELFAEDVDSQVVVLPEVTTTTEDVTLEDIRTENDEDTAEEMPEGDETEGPTKTRPIENTQEPPTASRPLEDDQVCISEGGELFAEDVDNQMAVLPEVTTTTEDVKLEDIRIENDAPAA